jgi:hypothetical protein
MKSPRSGTSTSEAEVTNIDRFGFWLLVNDREYFLSYKEYPWFRSATVEGITNVKFLRPNHLHWPALDVDLSIESLEHPEDFPLVYAG